jgi:hypothetical protein
MEAQSHIFSQKKNTISGAVFRAIDAGQVRSCQEVGCSTEYVVLCLPFMYRGFAGIQVAGKDGLTYLVEFANFLDLLRLEFRRHRQSRHIKAAHRGLVDGANLMKRAG